jgi:hypothetical protein
MNELERLIEKHRANGLLIDGNLLVLLFVGRTNRRRIADFKRTSKYKVSDYELLEQLVSVFRQTLTTPHVLTEASNLAKLAGSELAQIRQIMKEFVEITDELHETSRVVVHDHSFSRLGITDAAISTVCANVLVLTDDFELYDSLGRRGIDAVNFNHLREWRRQPIS